MHRGDEHGARPERMQCLHGIKSGPQRRGRPIRQIFKFKLIWGHKIRGWDGALADELRNARLDEHPAPNVPDNWITAITRDRIAVLTAATAPRIASPISTEPI